MGKASRDKGKVGEREVANILKDHGYEARRGVQYQGGPGSPDVVGLPGVHIEVKRTERLKLWEAVQQAHEERRCDYELGSGQVYTEMPVVLHRTNNKPWVAILPLEDFLSLYKKANTGGKTP